jgi:dihydropyrimidinase
LGEVPTDVTSGPLPHCLGMPLLIKNGTLCTATDTYRADVLAADEKIVQIGQSLSAPDGTGVVDAAGKYVLPGGIDPHTHLDTPSQNTTTADDYLSGTIAAACGGTTTIVNFCMQGKGQSLLSLIDFYRERAAAKAAIDYGFHAMISDLSDDVLAEIDALAARGVTSIKLFMAYRGQTMVDDRTIVRTLAAAKRNGILVMVHAENGDAADILQQQLLADGKLEPKYHATSRPPRVEAEATARAGALAEVIGAPIYVVHVSCVEAVEEITRARARGVDIMGETCTHYLYFTEDDLDRPDFEGAKWVYTPPARGQHQPALMWRAIANGNLAVVASDHCPFNFRGQKTLGQDNFTKIPNGAPGIEERLVFTYQGVNDGRLTINRFVDLVSTTPAKTFGLYPDKGTIAVGSDADLVIWNPDAELRVTRPSLHSAVDYTLYEGKVARGLPETVTLRGQVIVENREYVGTPGAGKFIARKTWGAAGA